MINPDSKILKWIEKNDLKTLHIIRRVIKLKKGSGLRKAELLARILDYYTNSAARKIQSIYRRKKIKPLTILCPFTLEKPEGLTLLIKTKKWFIITI